MTSIACTLSPAERPAREAQMRALGGGALLSADHAGRALTLRFRREPETLRRVQAFVEAESRCCAFFDFALEQRRAATVLTVTTPAGGEELLADLARAFAPA
jgi:hypothetical protein